MRLKAVLFDLVLLALTVPAVILLFRFIPDRQTAAFYAGLLFVAVPGVMMLHHRRLGQPNGRAEFFWWGGVLFFWGVFALPIFFLRLFSGDTPFAELSMLGIPAPQWHQGANIAYLIMCVAVVLAGWLSSAREMSRQK